MYTWDVETIQDIEFECLFTHESQVEIARTRAISVERRAILPPETGDSTAAEHYARIIRDCTANFITEALESRRISFERQTNHAFTFFVVGHLVVGQIPCHLVFHHVTASVSNGP